MLLRWKIAYSTGSTNSVSMVEVMIPPMTTEASGFWTSAPRPCASAIGTKPRAATAAVMSTGRRRKTLPSMTASSSSFPCFRKLLMKLIITRPLSTATPESAMKPTAAEMESGISLSHSAAMPPVSASGTPEKTSKASFTLPNVMKSNNRIRNSVIGITNWSRLVADRSCWNCPPYSIQ